MLMFRNAEKINSRLKADEKVGEPHYNQYLHEAIKDLKKGDVVLAFHKYQYEALKTMFGDKLESNYDQENNWWQCRLKESE